jgi:uncharacterized membrane protein YesL
MHTTNKRPLSVTVIGWIFLVAGVIGVAYHATEFRRHGPFQHDLVWVCLVRLLAIICAVFMLRGSNWARWLLVIWMAYHVILSAFHSPSQLIVHGILLAVIVYLLFRPPTSAYFRGVRAESAQINRDSARR